MHAALEHFASPGKTESMGKNPFSFFYRLEHGKFVFILKFHVFLCGIVKGFPF